MEDNRNKQTEKQLRSVRERAATSDVAGEYDLIAKARCESEKEFRSLVQYIPDAIWTTDKDQRIIFFSKNVKAVTGYTPEEEYEMYEQITWFDRIHPDDVESYRIAYNELFENKKPFNVMYRFKRRDGRWIWVHDRAIATYEKDGARYAHGLITDVTEYKQAESEIKKLKEKYESVIRHVPDAIYSCLPDETASMVFISARYKDWTGYSPQDFYKDPGLWPKTIHPKDRGRAVRTYIEAGKKKKAYLSEYRVVHKNTGQVRWVRDHGVPVIDENGKLVLFDGLFSDITEQKKLRENIQFYIREITMAQEQERKRLSRELHDETVQSLADLYTDIDEIMMKERLSANVIQRLQQLRHKVDNMLDEVHRFSHELQPGLLDEFGLIPSLEQLTEEMNTGGKFNCRINTMGSERRLPFEAETILFRITQEALRNIKKHSGATEGVINVEFCDGRVRLSITDNGMGFEIPDDLSSFARRHKLGIIGMQERAHLVNGSLSIKSKANKGTAITVEMPA
ncbi:MAG: PAS domain-containing protein [Dehalococcoidia bacterium]|nr:MAG: PAS domain-containing protein [Dehalococcoidia bacterium]